MDRVELYRDIAERTGGDIYFGVVGAVRTGKSTFIRKFMELLVLSSIDDEFERKRVTDELPQSGSGKAVMTTQPKFVPNEAVQIKLSDDVSLNVRMVDCVGYMIKEALGSFEEGVPRMVMTPWSDAEMPFEDAARLGTTKVIEEHSTIGLVVTTDGTITDIERSAYMAAEAEVIARLTALHKPFVIILNSKTPKAPEAIALRAELEEKYGTRCVLLDVLNMDSSDITELLSELLSEFPIRTVNVTVPAWVRALGPEHRLNTRIVERLHTVLPSVTKMKDARKVFEALHDIEDYSAPQNVNTDAGHGDIVFSITPKDNVFYSILSEECGMEIEDDYRLISMLREFASAKTAYDKLREALDEAERTGYGLVMPCVDEMKLEQPEIVRQGNRFGVRLRANASGLHLIKVDVDSEIAPLVGTQEQSEELVTYLLDTFEKQPEMIWKTNIFGKPLYDLVCSEMMSKVSQLPSDVRMQLKAAVQRIVNEGCNNLVCIML